MFYIDTFTDLFIGLRYYFDTNNGGLKVYKQTLFFTLILFIDLFIDFIDLRYYFDMNKGGSKVYKETFFFTLILFIDLFIDFIDLFIDFIDLFIDFRYCFNTNNGV